MGMPRPRGYLIGPGQGDDGLKASRADTGGSFTLIESDTSGGAPPHVHDREDEAMYVLVGTIVVHCGDEEFVAGPRAFVFLPRGVVHDWDVRGDRATVLILAAPGGLDEFLTEFHAAPDWDGRRAVAARYGITFG